MLSLSTLIHEAEETKRIFEKIKAGECPIVVSGLSRVHKAHIVATARRICNRPVVCIFDDDFSAKNALSDIAYREFSKVLPYPTVTYSHDFQTVCEDVYYGRADCCILPVENTSDGRLMRFRSLADKYELAIFLTCTVAAESGEVTKFALLRKEIAKSNIKSIFKDGDFFEFYTVISGDVSISDILITAQYFGLFPYKIDSTPISYTERAYSYDIVLKTDGGDLVSFLCYLFLEAPQFSPVGLYSQLKGN